MRTELLVALFESEYAWIAIAHLLTLLRDLLKPGLDQDILHLVLQQPWAALIQSFFASSTVSAVMISCAHNIAIISTNLSIFKNLSINDFRHFHETLRQQLIFSSISASCSATVGAAGAGSGISPSSTTS